MSEVLPRFRLYDMHCHLDRIADASQVADELAARDVAVFCTTVTPHDAMAAAQTFADTPNVRVGAGLHPWWLADGTCDTEDATRTTRLAAASRFVGEIGLDFSPRYEASRALQLSAFEGLVHACAEHPMPGRVLSIHAVHAAGTTLDILERYDLPAQTACIFHWFSGTSDDLARLRALGCFISVNEHMLASKRGREYARQIPLRQLLLETDAPPKLDAPYPAAAIEESLTRTLATLAELRGCTREELAQAIAQTSSQLLDL